MRPILIICIIAMLSTTNQATAAKPPAMTPSASETMTFRLLGAQSSSAEAEGRDTIMGYFTQIFRLGGAGFRESESAAFLVRNDEGTLGCLLWPKTNRFRKQQFHGRIPDGTIAIVHTHPRNTPHPSRGDRLEALRLGLTFIVLSPRDISEVSPDGEVIEVVRNRPWRLADRGQSPPCKPLSED